VIQPVYVLPATVPLLNGANTFTTLNTFTAGLVSTGAGTNSTLLGSGATAAGSQSVSIGLSSSSGGLNGVAIGALASASQNGTVAIGVSTVASAAGSVAVGNSASSTFAYGCALASGVVLAANELAYGTVQGLGVAGSFRLTGHSSTQPRSLFFLQTYWVSSTDASRSAGFKLTCNDAANATTGREVMRGESDGSQPLLGFFGSSAAAKPTVTGSRGGNAALASLLTALAGLGLLTDSSS
jgi:hypothetical protein